MTKSSLQLKVLAGLLLAIAGNASAATYTDVPAGATTGLPFAYFGKVTYQSHKASAPMSVIFEVGM